METILPNLSDQQKRFCDEYLVNFNAYRAAMSAGYSDNTARKGELLYIPKIQAYLKAAMNRTADRLQITHDMILRELAKVAFSSMGNYYDERGVLKPMCELTEHEKAAISQYQVLDAIDESGQRVGEMNKIKLHNKMSALDKIARHLNFYGNAEKKQEAGSGKQAAFSQQAKVLSREPEEVKDERLAADEELDEPVEAELLSGGGHVEMRDDVSAENGDDLGDADAMVRKILTLSPPCCSARTTARFDLTGIERFSDKAKKMAVGYLCEYPTAKI